MPSSSKYQNAYENTGFSLWDYFTAFLCVIYRLRRLTGQTIKIFKKKPKYIKMIVLEMLKQFNWLRLEQLKHLGPWKSDSQLPGLETRVLQLETGNTTLDPKGGFWRVFSANKTLLQSTQKAPSNRLETHVIPTVQSECLPSIFQIAWGRGDFVWRGRGWSQRCCDQPLTLSWKDTA